MKQVIFSILFILIIAIPKKSLSQYSTIDTTYSANQLAQSLAGHGVLISNASYSGAAGAKAKISCTNCGMPVTDGIMLSTGRCYDLDSIPSVMSSTDFLLPGDQILSTYYNTPLSSIFDAVTLEFDMTVLSDSFEISYSYLSEEYNEYTNSGCFDAFLILVDGVNIAFIPDTSLPVNVNTVNNGPAPFGVASNGPCNNCNYYVDNVNGTTMVYDGYTTLIKNKIPINPFIPHHVKIVLADFCDGAYNTALMLKSFSAKSSSTNNPCYLFSVEASPSDTLVCQGEIQLNANSNYPSSNYQWSPAIGLSDPNIRNPIASQVFDQTYVVVATHQNPNCIATDTIHITAAKDTNISYTTCNDTVSISLPNNSSNYNWISFTDTNNISVPLQDTSININAYLSGVYIGTASYQTCTITNFFNIIDTCTVATRTWPGDCNNDLSVNVEDLLYLAKGYLSSGLTRPNFTNTWDGYWGNNWNQTFANGVNYKNADCNGDGIISLDDTLAIHLNYGQTHTNRIANNDIQKSLNSIYLVASHDSAYANDMMYFDVMAGSNSQPIDSLLGLSFTVNFNPALISNSHLNFNATSTTLGTPMTDLIEMTHLDFSSGMFSVGISRNDQSGITNFNGRIGTIEIQVSSFINIPTYFNLTLSDVSIMKQSSQTISAVLMNDSTLLMPAITGIETFSESPIMNIYPNPSKDQLNIETSFSTIYSINIIDLAGRQLKLLPTISKNGNRIIFNYNIINLPSGIYTVAYYSNDSVQRRQFIKQ